MLQNGEDSTLTVHQIAAHLRTRDGNITRELNLAEAGQAGRLTGFRKKGPGLRGRGGQWRIDRNAYLDWLGVPDEDRAHVDQFGLPELVEVEAAAELIGARPSQVRALMIRLPHVTFGRRRYLTHHQMRRLRVLLVAEDCRETSR